MLIRSFLVSLASGAGYAADPRGPGVHYSMMAESALADVNLGHVALYVLLIGLLVVGLLGGAMVVLTVRMNSGREPSVSHRRAHHPLKPDAELEREDELLGGGPPKAA